MKSFLDNINVDSLTKFDVIHTFKSLLDGGGWFIDSETKKITNHHALDHNRPWIYVNSDDSRLCMLYNEIFTKCGFIPTRCLGCWKVVVKLDNVKDLFRLLEWQYEYSDGHKKDRFCKCGIEKRHWVHYQYGGYFYCDSKTEGLKRFVDVREAMDKINPNIDVILKRYCTEFEIKLGPSKEYQQPPLAKQMEKEIFAAFKKDVGNPKQPVYLIKHILRTWLEFAYDRGDKTALEFNDGKPFYTPTQTYHEGARLRLSKINKSDHNMVELNKGDKNCDNSFSY